MKPKTLLLVVLSGLFIGLLVTKSDAQDLRKKSEKNSLVALAAFAGEEPHANVKTSDVYGNDEELVSLTAKMAKEVKYKPSSVVLELKEESNEAILDSLTIELSKTVKYKPNEYAFEK